MVVEVVLFEDVDLKDKYLITGFQGVGFVGYISVKAMIEETGARKIGMIDSTYVPPFVSLDEDGNVMMPFEFFLDEKNNFVYLLVRFQPDRDEIREFAHELANFTETHKMKGLVLLGGLNDKMRDPEDETEYRCVVTNDFPLENPPLLEPRVIISGGIALILIELKKRSIPTLTLFPYVTKEDSDMVAASNAIKIINTIFGTDIKTEKLLEEAKDFESDADQILMHQKKKSSNDFYT
ncbi:MAG: proteasome assembly chaperone family protein [Candidatus Hodarchaeota archaeon]